LIGRSRSVAWNDPALLADEAFVLRIGLLGILLCKRCSRLSRLAGEKRLDLPQLLAQLGFSRHPAASHGACRAKS
jgi:hypothetical protein